MLQLQYIEEPVQDTADLADFYAQTHMSLALDETLDEGLPLGSAAGLGSKVQQVVSMLPFGAVAALVVKPGAVGGFERTHALAKAAAKQNIQVGQ